MRTGFRILIKSRRNIPDFLSADFLNATLDMPVPDPPRDEKGNITDSTWQYYYYRKHYFDNFNISDPRLLADTAI